MLASTTVSFTQRLNTLVERCRPYEWLISPSLVAIMAAIAYLPWVSQLGFYRDDWYQLWAGYIYGPESIATLFSVDRPFTGLLYSLAYRLLGPSPLPWQLYSFALRLAGALIFLWLVRWLWPRSRLMTLSMAVLFVVYPGFLQQPNANTFSNQLLTYTTGLFSIALTVGAVATTRRWRRSLLYFLSILTALAYWLNYEYMIGLEGLRIVLLWVAVSRLEFSGHRWRKVLAYWAPYIPALLVYLLWRGFIFEGGRATTDLALIIERFTSDPLRTMLDRLLEGGKDLFETTLFAWAVPVYELLAGAGLGEQIIGLLLGGLAASISLAYFMWLDRGGPDRADPDAGNSRDAKQATIIGGIAIAFAVSPVILAGRDVRWNSGFDRYTLHVTAGVAMFLVGAIWYLVRARARPWLIAGLIALSITTHYLNGLQWADHWRAQRELWWQLSWRAPQIQDSTVLIAEIPTGGFIEDYEIWAPANLIYSPVPGAIPITAEILNDLTAEKIKFGSEDARGMRTLIEFQRDYDNVLLLSYPSFGSCLHVIDGRRTELPRSASSIMRNVDRYSKIDRVIVDGPPSRPPESIFGAEPELGWCYYFQKADLARQAEDWAEVSRLADEVDRQGLRPSDRSEWMPFLEGYVNLERDDEAREIAVLIRQKEPIRHDLCDRLNPNLYADAERYAFLEQVLCEFN
ncbi:MAG: hypothetical protein ACC700_11965 [Anaerolineales bacterium]